MFKRTRKLAGDMVSVRPSRLFQVLFDFYREKGGDLDEMHNLLIDAKAREGAFDLLDVTVTRDCIEAIEITDKVNNHGKEPV